MNGCKAAASTPLQPEQQHKSSSWLRVALVNAMCALAAVHLARAARRAVRERDARDLAFVAAAHAVLALLFRCLARFEEAERAEARGRLRVWVWALSTALTAMFACRIWPVMSPPLNLVVSGMAVLVTVGGFALLFLGDAGEQQSETGDELGAVEHVTNSL